MSIVKLALVGFRGMWRRYVFLTVLVGLVLSVGGAGLVVSDNFSGVVRDSIGNGVGERLITVEPSFTGGGSGELHTAALRDLVSIKGVEGVSGHYFLSGDLVLTDSANAVPVTVVPVSSVVEPPLRDGRLPDGTPTGVEVAIPAVVDGVSTSDRLGTTMPLVRNVSVAPGETRSQTETVTVVGLVDEHWQLDGRNPVYAPPEVTDQWLDGTGGAVESGVPRGGFTRVSVLADTGVDTSDVLAAIQAKQYLASAGVQLDGSLPRSLDSFAGVAKAMRWLGSIVGLVLVFSMVRALMAGRYREIGILKSLGYRRATIAAAFAGESLLAALLGCVLGVLGCFAVALLVGRAAATDIPDGVSYRTLALPTASYITVLIPGALIAVAVSTWIPIWRAVRRSAMSILQSHR
ncbi:ABC transporter permease [Actinokineospora pegani]|uniref:ABC transporter permease n=1 Tax=Actinokineospora pegani TaxID=2654637 RepID=UPI0012EA8644|nr:ABC transporter permease [Actinokineospora pegani]